VHLLNSTLSATERTLCCLLETHQTPEGVKVPECLQPMVGMDFIPFVKKKEEPVKKEKGGAKQKVGWQNCMVYFIQRTWRHLVHRKDLAG
jgi:hypothetical protein